MMQVAGVTGAPPTAGALLGNAVLYTACSLVLAISQNSCSKLHCQKGLNLTPFSYKVKRRSFWVTQVAGVTGAPPSAGALLGAGGGSTVLAIVSLAWPEA